MRFRHGAHGKLSGKAESAELSALSFVLFNCKVR
jgi:hypothetical protein